jgi:hypothetical protein
MRKLSEAKSVLGLSFAMLLAACADPGISNRDSAENLAPAQKSEVVEARAQRQREAHLSGAQKDILFGDLHVHTSFSPDALMTGMPYVGGKGLVPPSAACDYARYCSALDFWSINDHAEGITPARWQTTKEMIRACNARAGDPMNPDTVAMLGWEWSQVSTEPEQHYGHKNVVFLDTDDAKVPTRAIAAPREKLNKAPMGRAMQWLLAIIDSENSAYYHSIGEYYDAIGDTPICEKGVDARELPDNCLEIADNPRELFDKLDQWGFESIVIPHGNAWGLNTPPGTCFDKQLNLKYHDPQRQTLIEVFSGHGNSEEYRDWRSVAYDDSGAAYCPEPSDAYLPCCWQAGNIIQTRCEDEGIDAAQCLQRATEARQNFVDAGISGHLTVPGQQVGDWLNCGQCEDCYMEPMDHRPMTSTQYALAITNFDNPEQPLNFRFGFIGSSDTHGAAPGVGYKEKDRLFQADGLNIQNERMARSMMGDARDPEAQSIPKSELQDVGLNKQRNMERQSSFWMTGGLVAVHSDGRNREAIWDGLKTRNVYATSGDRLLLWFDEISGENKHPMGTEISRDTAPVFSVRAAGAFEQLPGCPQHAVDAIGEDGLETLCGGECYNPATTRHALDRIEIIRILPQRSADEDVGKLIEDPWRVIDCEGKSICEAQFSDETFVAGEREAVYYARALQKPTDTINGRGLRCEYDDNGVCIAVNPCYADARTAPNDDCLAPAAERAWSSPIFVKPALLTE